MRRVYSSEASRNGRFGRLEEQAGVVLLPVIEEVKKEEGKTGLDRFCQRYAPQYCLHCGAYDNCNRRVKYNGD